MVTRYSPGVKYSPEMGVYSPDMNVRSGGNYTLYSDYAKLKLENKILKSNRIGEVKTVLIEELSYKIEQLEADNKRLEECLNEIQSQCVGEIAMGYKLDSEGLGSMIYERTGIKQGLGWKP